MPSSSSSTCMKCRILQERLKQVESELRAARQESTTYMGRQGARTSRHDQQLVEAPREQNLLMNLEQQFNTSFDGAGASSQPNQQEYEVPLQQIGDQADMLTQLELHHQQQQSVDLLRRYNTSSDGAGPSNHHHQQQQQRQSMDLSVYNTSSDGAGPSNQHEQQELYEALQQESLKNDILKKLKDLFSLILQQPQKPRREMLDYIRGFTQPQIMPQQQNQPSQPQPPLQQNQP